MGRKRMYGKKILAVIVSVAIACTSLNVQALASETDVAESEIAKVEEDASDVETETISESTESQSEQQTETETDSGTESTTDETETAETEETEDGESKNLLGDEDGTEEETEFETYGNEAVSNGSSNDLNTAVYDKLNQYRSDSMFGSGVIWGGTTDGSYSWNGCRQCCGFALQFANTVFGTYPATLRSAANGATYAGWTCYYVTADNYNTLTVEPGDIIDSPSGYDSGGKIKHHTAMVLSGNNSNFTCVQCNYKGGDGVYNKIHYGEYFNYNTNRSSLPKLWAVYGGYTDSGSHAMRLWKPSDSLKRGATGSTSGGSDTPSVSHGCDASITVNIPSNNSIIEGNVSDIELSIYDYHGIKSYSITIKHSESGEIVCSWSDNLSGSCGYQMSTTCYLQREGNYEITVNIECTNGSKYSQTSYFTVSNPNCNTIDENKYGGSIEYGTESGYWAEIGGCINDMHGIGTCVENVYLVEDDEEILVKTETTNDGNATGKFILHGYTFENYGLHKFTLTQTCQSGYVHYYEFYLNYEDPNAEPEDVCHASGTLTSSEPDDITNKKTITLSGNVHDDSGLTAYDIYYRLIDETEEKLYYEKSGFYGEVTDAEFEENITFPDYGTYYISLKVKCANKSVHEVDSLVLTYSDYSGKIGDILWDIDENGHLTITGEGDYINYITSSTGNPPWSKKDVKTATVSVTGITSTANMFHDCSNLTNVNLSELDTSNVTDMSEMFSGCGKLEKLTMGNFNTENAITMERMFLDCSSLTDLDLSGFDTARVTNMDLMFNSCESLTSLDLSGFNTEKVTSAYEMFSGCRKLEELDLSSFDLSSLEDDIFLFTSCDSLKKIYTPCNLSAVVPLDGSGPEEQDNNWYQGEDVITELPKGLSHSVLIIKGKVSTAEDIRDITVEFDLQGLGTKIDPVTVKSGEKIIKPANPTAEGYSFEGWYREPECKTAWDFQKDTVTADITLYAKWTQNQSDGYDLSSFNFQMTDIRNPEKKADFKGADGKQAVIIFGGIGTCSRTESALESLSTLTSMADMSRLNIYAFEINKASDNTIRTRTANISSQIIINSIENDTAYNNLFINCFRETLGGGSLSMPLIIYKGTDGKIYKYTTNATDLPSIIKNIEEGGLKINYNASCQLLNITGEVCYEQAWEVLVRLNEERAKEGLNALEMDSDLLEAAMLRAAECSLYYSHTRPDGTECFTASNKISGENIAVGHKNANEAMDSWMNSEGHRKNILNSGYRSVGIGCFYINGTYRWVQCFGIGNVTDAAKKSNLQKSYAIKAVPEHVSPYLVEKSGNLKTGESIQLKVESSHEVYRTSIDANSYRWESGNTETADVSNTGLVTAKKEGSAVITGYNISDETLTLTYSLTVGEEAEGEFIVTFDTQGGTEVPAVRAAKDSVITEPEAPKRKGYTFGGWYKEAACINAWDFANDKVTDHITLYAHWIEGEQPEDPPTEPETGPDDTENQGDGLWISGISKSGYPYIGEAIKPVVKVYDKTTLLTEKADYTISYKNNTKAGQATITVTGKGNYAGKETVTFDILPIDIGSEEIHAMDYYVKIGTKAQKPVPELYYMGAKLKNNTDFTISYSNTSNVYTQPGEYSVTVTGKGNYTGTRTLTLIAVEKIAKSKPVNIAKATLNGFDKTFTYTGKACKQECTLMVKTSEGEKILTEGMDYTVQYANNIKAGTATVTYYGRNGYTGKLKKTYKILPYDILNDTMAKIKYENYFECIYAKGGSTPKPVVTFEGRVMKEGVDYTLSYKNNKAVFGNQTPCVTVNGKGCFKGKIPINFTIKAQDLSKMTLVSGDRVYKNKANIYKITPKLMDLDGKILSSGKDFDPKSITYVYENDVILENGVSKKAGSEVEKTDIIPVDSQIRITLNCGNGSNYIGTFTGTYRIVRADIKSAKVTIPKQIYTGNEITLDKSQITVKLSEVMLNSEDYEIVRYDNNVKKGKASVTIKGNGNYGGTKTVKFTIGTKGFLWWWRK